MIAPTSRAVRPRSRTSARCGSGCRPRASSRGRGWCTAATPPVANVLDQVADLVAQPGAVAPDCPLAGRWPRERIGDTGVGDLAISASAAARCAARRRAVADRVGRDLVDGEDEVAGARLTEPAPSARSVTAGARPPACPTRRKLIGPRRRIEQRRGRTARRPRGRSHRSRCHATHRPPP
jgi:hypothetical protein